jgi:hypothetical protein
MPSNQLQKQLEMSRFQRALEIAESLAEHRALLTTAELARLNNVLTGSQEDPWRQEPVTIQLPTGKMETFLLHVDPKITAREILHQATELAETGQAIDAAVDVYAGLVLAHIFNDANRRAAVLAAHYYLKRYNINLSGVAIYQKGLGDLRESGQIEQLRESIHLLVDHKN